MKRLREKSRRRRFNRKYYKGITKIELDTLSGWWFDDEPTRQKWMETFAAKPWNRSFMSMIKKLKWGIIYTSIQRYNRHDSRLQQKHVAHTIQEARNVLQFLPAHKWLRPFLSLSTGVRKI